MGTTGEVKRDTDLYLVLVVIEEQVTRVDFSTRSQATPLPTSIIGTERKDHVIPQRRSVS